MPSSIGYLSRFSSVYHLRAIDGCVTKRRISSSQVTRIRELLEAMPQAMTVRHDEMSRKLCDSHIHTTRSDGNLSPNQLFAEAVEKGVGTLVLTDHFDAGNPLEDIMYASASGLDYNFAGMEFGNMNREDAPHHFKAYFNPLDQNIFKVISNIFRGDDVMPYPMLSGIRDSKVSDILSMMPPKFFETLEETHVKEPDIYKVAKKLVARIKQTPDYIERVRKLHIKKIPFFEAVDRATFQQFWPNNAIFRRRQILHGLFRFLPAEIFSRHVSHPRTTAMLQALTEAGCWISLAHPDCSETIGGGRKEVTQTMIDLVEQGLLKGVEISQIPIGSEIYEHYSQMAKNLDLHEDGGSDFHTPKNRSLGKTHDGRPATSHQLFDTVRQFLSSPVLAQADTMLGEDNYWEALRLLRQAMIINPYNTGIYDKIHAILGKV